MTAILAYYRTESVGLRECMELFFKEREAKSSDTASTYYYAINNMSNEIFGVDIQFAKREQLESLNFNVLNKYKMKLKETSSNTTVNNRISAIKSFIKYLTARGAISYDISTLSLVELLNNDSERTEMIPLSVLMQYVEFFETKEQRKGKEKKWVSLLALETGNRIQDLLSIKKNQFTKDGEDYILKSKGENRGKGNKEYIERIGAELYEELMALNPHSDKVFSIKYRAILDAFNRANDHFGNTDVKYTPHSIKHLCVQMEYSMNKDILAASKKANHSSVTTTQLYLRTAETTNVGVYTRMKSTKQDKYKEASLEDLISVISELPADMQFLINKKLEDLSNNHHDKM